MIKVTQGQIHVNSVDVYKLGDDSFLVYIDTKAKYPDVAGISRNEIYLVINERTLYAERDKEATTILVEMQNDISIHCVDTGRYSVMAVLHKKVSDLPLVEEWFDSGM